MEFKFKTHPVLESPSEDDILEMSQTEEGLQLLVDWHKDYHEALRMAIEEPIEHGFVLDQQRTVEEMLRDDNVDEVWVFGGWRSGKSRSAAKIVVQSALANPNAEIICWAQNEDASVERQQPYIWDMLPPKYKCKMKDTVAKINYSKATGFAGKKCILPNGAVIYFKFYSQFQNDDTMLEGANLGALPENVNSINIGSWLDEYLGDETLVERVRGRCSEKNSKILVTFTPVDGYTPTVKSVMDGATTMTSKAASLLNGKQMPLTQQPRNRPNVRIAFYHTEDNPFANFERLRRDLIVKSEADIMKLAYGYPTKSMTAMFNTFDMTAHVYDPGIEVYNFADSKQWTTYQVIDPAGAKSWCCIWASVNADNDIRIWAEFPDRDTYGEWAVEGKSVRRDGDSVGWKKGPAAVDNGGLSYRQLETEWTKIEGNVRVFERIIDIRFSNSPHQTANDGQVTIADELAEIGILTVPSLGSTEDLGLPLIHEALSYNSKNPYDYNTNRPRLRISRECGNLLFSLMNYCKNGKKDEPLKDFIDVLRYLMTANGGVGPEHYTQDALKHNATTGGY